MTTAAIAARAAPRGTPGLLLALGVLMALAFDAHAGSLQAQVKDAGGKPVESAVFYVEPAAGGIAPPPAGDSVAVIDQIDKEFVPRVVAVAVGTRVSFPNRDDIRHHVYSFSETRKFELPLYEGTPAEPVLFDVPGVVTLGCNIHDWMRGYIVVLPTPWFGISGKDGNVDVDGLPAGAYRVFLWHPDLEQGAPTEGAALELGAADTHTVAFTLALKPALRIRRAPASRRGDRY